MKRLMMTLTIAIVAITAYNSSAQVSLNINIGAQPNWGPRGYDYVEYYYLPEIRTYYHVPTRRYVYYEGNSWVRRTTLPRAYRGYDLYKGRKVVINEPRPYLRNRTTQVIRVDKHGPHHKGPKHHKGKGRH